MIMLASTLMHLSETKHHLQPALFGSWSRYWLDYDRLITSTIGPFYVWFAWRQNKSRDVKLWSTFLVGAVALRVGEYRTDNAHFNYIACPILHTIWHAAVYRIYA